MSKLVLFLLTAAWAGGALAQVVTGPLTSQPSAASRASSGYTNPEDAAAPGGGVPSPGAQATPSVSTRSTTATTAPAPRASALDSLIGSGAVMSTMNVTPPTSTMGATPGNWSQRMRSGPRELCPYDQEKNDKGWCVMKGEGLSKQQR